MSRPSFQFYPADWRNNAKLRRCSEAARGAWIDILCILHDSDEYGLVRWPLAELARAAGVPIKLVRDLVSKQVLKGGDGPAPEYVFRPRHANQEGAPVILVPASDSPCWYSSRMVRDEYIRQHRGNSSRFSSENQPPNPSPNISPKASPKPPLGDGPSSSSSSSKKREARSTGKRLDENWVPSPDDIAHCKAKRPDLDAMEVAESFRDYWLAAAGKSACKRDWSAAWRTWVRNERVRPGSDRGQANANGDWE